MPHIDRTLIILTTLLTACASSPTPTQRAAEAVQMREPSLREQADTLIKTDRNAAHVLYAQLCDEGDGASCLRAADTLSPDLVVERANFRARACDLGSADGCSSLGLHSWYGRGVDADLDRAVELERQACADGVDLACERAETWSELMSTRPAGEIIEHNQREDAFNDARGLLPGEAYGACEAEFDAKPPFTLDYTVTDDGEVVAVELRDSDKKGTATERCFQRVLIGRRLPPGFANTFAAIFIR